MGRYRYHRQRPSVHVRRTPPMCTVANSALMQHDKALADRVDHGIKAHCVKGTISTYATARRDYERFCHRRGLPPMPVDPVTYCGWLHVTSDRILMTSLTTYMAGIHDASVLAGHGWSLSANEMVRRTMRYLKRKHPAVARRQKVPITVRVLFQILPLLPGWPNMAEMSAEDRVFASASITGVAGFLRGGEFLDSAGNSRTILKSKSVYITSVSHRKALVVGVPQPKARWWEKSQAVPCFANNANDTFCPVRLYREYSTRCPGLTDDGPAFLLHGKALTRDYMVERTTKLMMLAGMDMNDHRGLPMDVRAASWRSGAVCSALAARVTVPQIMVMGRWSSSAWESYMLRAPLDLHAPSQSMWDHGICSRSVPTVDVEAALAPALNQGVREAVPGMGVVVADTP
jgi:hypothetical protein